MIFQFSDAEFSGPYVTRIYPYVTRMYWNAIRMYSYVLVCYSMYSCFITLLVGTLMYRYVTRCTRML